MIRGENFEESLIQTLESNSPEYPKEHLPFLLEVVKKLATDLNFEAIGLIWVNEEDLKLFIVEMFFPFDLFLQVQIYPNQTINDEFAITIFHEDDIKKCSGYYIDEVITLMNIYLEKYSKFSYMFKNR